MVLEFSDDGHLPPGRYSCTYDEAQDFLTKDALRDASSRNDLWNDLERFLARYVGWEEEHQVRLLHRMWLGGSFVSSKLDPNNLDVTLFLHADAILALKGKVGSRKLIPSRESVAADFRISPVFVKYVPIPNVFRLDILSDQEREYFANRGRWDDWWQRRRLDDSQDRSPSLATCRPRRGYLEVMLDDDHTNMA